MCSHSAPPPPTPHPPHWEKRTGLSVGWEQSRPLHRSVSVFPACSLLAQDTARLESPCYQVALMCVLPSARVVNGESLSRFAENWPPREVIRKHRLKKPTPATKILQQIDRKADRFTKTCILRGKSRKGKHQNGWCMLQLKSSNGPQSKMSDVCGFTTYTQISQASNSSDHARKNCVLDWLCHLKWTIMWTDFQSHTVLSGWK